MSYVAADVAQHNIQGTQGCSPQLPSLSARCAGVGEAQQVLNLTEYQKMAVELEKLEVGLNVLCHLSSPAWAAMGCHEHS